MSSTFLSTSCGRPGPTPWRSRPGTTRRTCRSFPAPSISDAVEGGLWTVAVDVPAAGFVAYFYGRYTAVVENARLEHTMAYTQSAEEFAARDESAPHHRILVEFESRDFRSWVKFSQFGDLPEGQAVQAQAGMESYFDSLEAYLS